MSYSWYRKGTATTTNGSDVVRFQNADVTTSPNKPVVGDAFTVDSSELYETIFIGSDATGEFIRLDRPYAQASVSNAKYALVRLASSTINAKIAAIAAAAINQKQISLDDMYEWYTSTADTVDFLGPDGVPVTLTTYHYLSNAIGSVGGSIADVEAVARELVAVKTVSSNIANVNTVGTDIIAVNTVSTDIADVKTVSANILDVKSVGSNITEVKAVGSDMPAISAVNLNIDEIKAVNANMPAINNVNNQVAHIDQQVTHVDSQKLIVDQQTTIATTKAAESSQSASESLASKNAAKISETNSKNSEVNSKLSETNSKLSETNAKASEDASSSNAAATAADVIATAADRVATGQDVISAKASEVKAEEWATKMDGSVDGVKYSSAYWANVAKMNADLTFLSGGVFKPTATQEYPVPENPTRDTLFLIGFDNAADSYTFTSGNLSGVTVFNTDQLLWDVPANIFVHVPSPTGAAILSVNNKTGSTITLRSEDIPHEQGTVFTELASKVNKTDIATLSEYGVTLLSNSFDGASESKAVTEKAISDGLNTKLDKSGGIITGDLQVGQGIKKNVRATGHLVSGGGSGAVALTTNDGYGNSIVAFNHENGIPDNTSPTQSSYRIVTDTDSNAARMSFQLKSSTTQGQATGLPLIMELEATEDNSTRTATLHANADVRGKLDIGNGAGNVSPDVDHNYTLANSTVTLTRKSQHTVWLSTQGTHTVNVNLSTFRAGDEIELNNATDSCVLTTVNILNGVMRLPDATTVATFPMDGRVAVRFRLEATGGVLQVVSVTG